MIAEIIKFVLDLTADLGILVVPVALIAVIALGLFAKNSFKLFKFVLPLLGAAIGAYFGAGLLGKTIATAVPGLAEIIQPVYLVAIVFALIVALIVAKHVKFTIFLVGAGLGYIIIAELVKTLLLNFDFVRNTAISAGIVITHVVGYIIAIAVAVLCAILLKKFFKPIYIIATSIAGMVAAAGVGAIFLFANTSIAEIAVLVCAVIGLVFGIVAAVKQFKNTVDYEIV